MKAYIYNAGMLCAACAELVMADKRRAGVAPDHPEDESSFDSDDFPKGPYDEGGGEADTPQHCDSCHVFLENPLTQDGAEYVAAHVVESRRDNKVVAAWADFYKDEIRDFWKDNPVSYRECEICGAFHPDTFGGDCRDKENRFTREELDEIHGSEGWRESPKDTEKCVSALRVGDLVDLQKDPYADPKGNSPEYEFEYSEVYAVESETPNCMRVDFVGGPSVGFPPDHKVKVAAV